MNKVSFKYERQIWRRDFKVVAGCDEVGRGCFAGPVVAACVVFSPNIHNTIYNIPVRVDDSKKLSPLQRMNANKWIRKNALIWGVGIGTVSEINRLGMSKATHSAFRRAISDANKKLKFRIDYLLIDAFYVPYIREFRIGKRNGLFSRRNPKVIDFRSRQLAIINGDEKSFSIAAASIIAKVYRDKLMYQIGSQQKYKKYGWGSNKGYGTKKHQEAILEYGVTRYHRKSFVTTFISRAI